MYSLDINFLKDRHLETGKGGGTPKIAAPSLKKQLPVIIGGGVAALLALLALGLWQLLGWQTTQTEDNIKQLEAKLKQLNAQNQSIQEIEKQVTTANEEVKALVTVFNQIKPWSAIFQELGDQIPPGVQITGIQQAVAPPDPKDTTGVPGIQLTINGFARNYSDVNDFLLTLQSSKFLKAERTKLQTAREAPFPIDLENADSFTNKKGTLEFPPGVQYTIITEMNSLPASELLPQLANKGAVGLVTRIKTLEQKGVIQP